MITCVVGNIIETKAEAIINASNGIGIMGAGVAGAIARAGGPTLVKEAKELCRKIGKPIEAGQYYKTSAGELNKNGVKFIYHAVTMMYPGGLSSLEFVSHSFRAIIQRAIRDDIKSLCVPGLGIGIGHLDKESVARIMVRIAQSFANEIEIEFRDFDEEFISYVKDFSYIGTSTTGD
jgi:O-acetyl-ADP-ribose deacetylase (regulator of RNase III)